MPDDTASPAPAPHGVRAAELPTLRALLAVTVGVTLVAALYVGREVLIPVTLAVLLSFILAPVVAVLRRLWLGRALAVLLAALLALGALLFASALIAGQVAELATDLPRYAARIERKIDTLRGMTVDRVVEALDRLGGALGETAGEAAGTPERPAGRNGEAPPPVPVELRQPPPGPLDVAQRIVTPLLLPLANAAIVFVVAVFILLQREDLRDRVIRLAGAADLHRTTIALDDAARRLSRYFLTQLLVNTSYGTVVGLALFLIGVPGALLWGILAGLMRYVPFVGTPIAAAPPVILAAAVDPGWGMALAAGALMLAGEALMGQVVEPVAFGHSTGLSPVAVILAAIFWSWLWGPIGLILAMPLTLCLVVLGRHVERLAFLDVLLGDRPALSPAESFYQRMLAGDPDEALDQAEQWLRTRPISAYYDEVLLEGLRLAAADLARGRLPPERLAELREAAQSVIGDLAAQPDTPAAPAAPTEEDPARPAPPPSAPPDLQGAWASPRAVLCIAGRGPLDGAVAAMLAQLLGRHGLGAEVVLHGAVARDQVARLDAAGVAMLCICQVEITGRPAHLRYLLRRLRQRLPQVPILVGLWPPGDPMLTEREPQAALGADLHVASLRDAVGACVAAARAAAQAERPAEAAE